MVSITANVNHFRHALLLGCTRGNKLAGFGRKLVARIHASNHHARLQNFFLRQYTSRTAFTLKCPEFVSGLAFHLWAGDIFGERLDFWCSTDWRAGFGDALDNQAIGLQLACLAASRLDILVAFRAEWLRATHQTAVGQLFGLALRAALAISEKWDLTPHTCSTHNCATVEARFTNRAALTIRDDGNVIRRTFDHRAEVIYAAFLFLLIFLALATSQFDSMRHRCYFEQKEKEKNALG